MLRKGLLLGLVLAGLCLVASPALAYVELVLAPSGYSPSFDENGVVSNPPELTVAPSEQFLLELSVWTDENDVVTGGINAYIYFDPDHAKVKDENGNITTNPVNPVLDENCEIAWSSMMPTNSGNNTTGKVSYEQQTGMSTQPVPEGKTHIGWLEFHCEGAGDVEIYPGTDSSLMPGLMPGNSLTSYHGTVVHQVPEPATLVLLGSGLVLGGFAYRRRRS